MTHIDWNPDDTKLRQFGFIAIGGFGLIGLVVYFKLFRGLGFGWANEFAFFLWALAVICPVLSFVKPSALKPIFLGMSAIGLMIGFLVSHILLAILFFGVFTPIAIFFKLVGRDALSRRLDPTADTYWLDRESERTPEDYYRQF